MKQDLERREKEASDAYKRSRPEQEKRKTNNKAEMFYHSLDLEQLYRKITPENEKISLVFDKKIDSSHWTINKLTQHVSKYGEIKEIIFETNKVLNASLFYKDLVSANNAVLENSISTIETPFKIIWNETKSEQPPKIISKYLQIAHKIDLAKSIQTNYDAQDNLNIDEYEQKTLSRLKNLSKKKKVG